MDIARLSNVAEQQRMPLQGRAGIDPVPRMETLALVQRIWAWPGLKMHHKGLFIWLAERREGARLPALVPCTVAQICVALDATSRTVERWLKDLVDVGLLRIFERCSDGGTIWLVADPQDLGNDRVVRDDGSRPLFDKFSDPDEVPPALRIAGDQAQGSTDLTSKMTSKMATGTEERAEGPPRWPSLKEQALREWGKPPDLTTNLTSKMADRPPEWQQSTKEDQRSSLPKYQRTNPKENHQPALHSIGALLPAAIAAPIDRATDPIVAKARWIDRIHAVVDGPTDLAEWVAGAAANLAVFHDLGPELDHVLCDVDAMRRAGSLRDGPRLFHQLARRLANRHGKPWPSAHGRREAHPNGQHVQRE
jgi:DNA-binding transcriptional ArsR family regulator